MKTPILVLMALFMLILPIFAVSEAQVIQITPQQQFDEGSPVQKFVNFVLGATVIGGVLVILFMIFIVIILIWVMKRIRDDKTLYGQLLRTRKRMANIHKDKLLDRRGGILGFFKHNKNYPIKIINKEGERIVNKEVGYYRGHYYGHEGTLNVLFTTDYQWLVVPKKELLVINKNPKLTYSEIKQDDESRAINAKEVSIDLPINIEAWEKDGLYIYAKGIDKDLREGFWFPVLADEKGQIINMNFPTFKQMQGVVLESLMYQLTDAYAQEIRKAIELDSTLKKRTKLQDSTSEIDIPFQQPQPQQRGQQ